MTSPSGKIWALANQVGKKFSEFCSNSLLQGRWLVWMMVVAIACLTISTSFEVAEAASSKSSNLQAQLVSEIKTIQPGTPFWVALQIKIRPGWHIYWKNPGDSGTAPTVQWTLPKGFKVGELVFPYPERLPIGPLMNFGYKDEVYLLTEVNPRRVSAGSPVTLRAKADILVCQAECIPEQITSELL